MTKSNAIKTLRELISYKENSLEILNGKTFTTDLEEIRQGMARIAQDDKKIIEFILSELLPKKEINEKGIRASW